MEIITVPLAIIAVTRQIKEAIPTVNGLITLIVAIALGALAGYFHVGGVNDVATGILLAIAAVGGHTVARTSAGRA